MRRSVNLARAPLCKPADTVQQHYKKLAICPTKGNSKAVQPAFKFCIENMRMAHVAMLKGEWETWKEKW